MLEVGEKAPEFTLSSDTGEAVSLSDYRGKKVVLYFYPKDDTPGCTIQACDFRDLAPEFESEGAVVLGVSPDREKSHRRFKKKYDLPFTLLVDSDHTVAERYGAWGPKKLYGKLLDGILRTTYIIDEEGRIERVFEKVKAKGHGERVLAAVKANPETP